MNDLLRRLILCMVPLAACGGVPAVSLGTIRANDGESIGLAAND